MIEFLVWYLVLLISYLLILFLYMHFSSKFAFYENLVGFLGLSFVLFHILLFLNLMFQDVSSHSLSLSLFSLSLGLPILSFLIIISISSLVYIILKFGFKIQTFTRYKEKMMARFAKRSKLRNDIYRKIAHVSIFIGLFILWSIGTIIVQDYSGSTEGMIPDENNMLYLYIRIFTQPDSFNEVLFSLGWFYYLLFFFFYSFIILMFSIEFTRKTRYFSSPFNFICAIYLCDDEEEGYGAYLYFTLGQMIASFMCPPMVFLAILGMSSIADLMTSQVGIRIGKHKIRFNSNKSWEGTIAGCITSFIMCIFFLGFIWATIFTTIFFSIDIITKKPVNISDNLLIPMGCALVYVLIRYFLAIDYTTLLLIWI